MIVLSYDIADDKLRNRFSKYILRFGHRIQYSVYEIDNSPQVLDNIIQDINNIYGKKFGQEDSIYIFKLSQNVRLLGWVMPKMKKRIL